MPTASTQTPYDAESEEAIIGECLRNPAKVAEIAFDLYPGEFWSPRHQALFGAYQKIWETTAAKFDVITWAREAGVEVGDTMPAVTNTFGMNRGHVDIVKKHALARGIMTICSEARNRAGRREDPSEIIDDLDFFISSAGEERSNDPEAVTMWELAEKAESEAPWVVEGLLRTDWRAIITGDLGSGKGVLMRTISQSIAAGFHPLTHNPCTPQRVLLVDCENPEAAVVETGVPLLETLTSATARRGGTIDETMMKIWHKPEAINIRNRVDRAALTREIISQRPSLVAIGPWYKMQRSEHGDGWEEAALATLDILDKLRKKYGFALIIEAHAAKGHKEPLGSVYLGAWPEIGIHLERDERYPEVLNITKFRGDRMKARWPDRITRNPHWIINGEWERGSVPF